MRVLIWHLHGSWLTAFVQGRHSYVVPVDARRGPYGLGRARTWDWPASVVERTPDQLRAEDIDVVVLQRPHELGLAAQWLGRTPGRDLPAIFLEHNAPPSITSRHPLADQSAIGLVHVTHFNDVCWDSGRAATTVIEHGVVDPGERYTGEVETAAVVVNEPVRRGRTVGTDLLGGFLADGVPLDVFGMSADALPTRAGLRTYADLPDQAALHTELARRRLYLHPMRWTSLGLSLIEAMLLGLPVVALAATEVIEAVPAAAGVVSTDLRRLHAAARTYLSEPEAAVLAGKAARSAALERYGLGRFLADWDRLLSEVSR